MWIIQTLKISLFTLHLHNQERRDKKGKVPPEVTDFRKALEEWLQDFSTFVEHVSLPLKTLAANLEEVIAPLSSTDYLDMAGVEANAGEFPLCRDEYSTVTISEINPKYSDINLNIFVLFLADGGSFEACQEGHL